jgi:hypothetical protein
MNGGTCRSAKVPLTTDAARTGSVGLYCQVCRAMARTRDKPQQQMPPTSSWTEKCYRQDSSLEAHSLAKRPEMTVAEIITGPSSVIRLFAILGLMRCLLGRVTPEDRI